MPLSYPTDQVLETEVARMIHAVGIYIHTPVAGTPTIELEYDMRDVNGISVQVKSITKLASYFAQKYPADFATVFNLLKRIAYAEGVAAGICPPGGAVV